MAVTRSMTTRPLPKRSKPRQAANKVVKAREKKSNAVAFKKTQARKDGKHTELRFPFLNLPAELRNNIYKLVLLEKSPIKFGRPFGSQQRFPKTPKLLQVCSRIRNEAMGMWLEGNEFAVTVWNCDARLL